jgi:hypothetical protein
MGARSQKAKGKRQKSKSRHFIFVYLVSCERKILNKNELHIFAYCLLPIAF